MVDLKRIESALKMFGTVIVFGLSLIIKAFAGDTPSEKLMALGVMEIFGTVSPGFKRLMALEAVAELRFVILSFEKSILFDVDDSNVSVLTFEEVRRLRFVILSLEKSISFVRFDFMVSVIILEAVISLIPNISPKSDSKMFEPLIEFPAVPAHLTSSLLMEEPGPNTPVNGALLS